MTSDPQALKSTVLVARDHVVSFDVHILQPPNAISEARLLR
jgi:hypothetical protein